MTRLMPFLLASAVLHGALLAAPGNRAQVEAGAGREIISITLEGRGAHSASTDKPVNTVRATPMASVPVTASSRATDYDAPAVVEPDVSDQHDQNSAARVRASVLNDLAQHFYYPPLARLRAWEGQVLLAFQVQQDGRLQEPRLVHSSGFRVLDEAALNSLRKVVRVAEARGTPLDMVVPVVYRLTDAQ